jgi:hypothetical protein
VKPPVLRGLRAWAGRFAFGDRLERPVTSLSIANPSRGYSVGILSTDPSAHRSVGTLANALAAVVPQMSVHVVRPLPAQPCAPLPHAALELNKFDVVIVQHECGIHSQADAEQLLDLVELLRVPVVLAVGAIQAEPTAHQRYVLEILAVSAEAVVAMSQSVHHRLLDEYPIEPHRIHAYSAGRGDLRHVSQERLDELLRQADVVSPPRNRSQVTSGVLTHALAAMFAVISTRLNAREPLGDGQAGVQVKQEDAAAMAGVC